MRKRKSVVGGKTRKRKVLSQIVGQLLLRVVLMFLQSELSVRLQSICEQPWRQKTLYCLLVTVLASEDGVLLIAFDL
jgi:hypothetical protein